MKAYSYDSITKEYRREVECQLDTLETIKQNKVIFLLPAGSTFEKPTTAQQGKVSIFENNKWSIKDDFRGIYYDKTTKEKIIISEINQSISNNLTNKIPLAFDDTCKWSSTKWIIDSVKVAEIEKATQKEIIIHNKTREMAIEKAISDGDLDSNGDLP